MWALPSSTPFLGGSSPRDDRALLLELDELSPQETIAGDEGGDATELMGREAPCLDMLAYVGGGGVEATVPLGDDHEEGLGLSLLATDDFISY